MEYEGRRDAAYAQVFGSEHQAFADDDEGHPPIEVRRYTGAPVPGGPVCDTWVTVGMSDVAMKADDGASLRRELIFYAQSGGDYAVPLRAIASYPFENDTFLEHGHSIQTFGTLFSPGGAEALLAEEPSSVELPHGATLAAAAFTPTTERALGHRWRAGRAALGGTYQRAGARAQTQERRERAPGFVRA